MHYKQIVVVTSLALTCHAAVAAAIDWGTHGPLEQHAGTVQPGSFTDIIDFTLGHGTPLAVSIVANNLSPRLQIIGGTISLYERTAEGLTLEIGSHDFGGNTGDTVRLFDLDPGDYLYAIKGYATGTSGGWYTVASAPLTVAEPQAALLALCAFMVMGALYQRKARH